MLSNKKISISSILRGTIFSTCLIIVTWQGVVCIQKFLSKPQVTRIWVEKARKNIYPTISVCPNPTKNSTLIYKSEVLEECGFENVSMYQYKGQWANPDHELEYCRNPEQLYEMIVAKPEDLILKAVYTLFDSAKGIRTILKPGENDSQYFIPMENRYFGRCFNINPPQEILKSGIFYVTLKLKSHVKVFLHNKGQFSLRFNQYESV